MRAQIAGSEFEDKLSPYHNSHSALLANPQMVGDLLKLLARQLPINKPGRLFFTQMRARLVKDFRQHGEESRVGVDRKLDPAAASFALAQVIGYRQKLLNAERLPAVIVNLFMGKVFDQESINPTEWTKTACTDQ